MSDKFNVIFAGEVDKGASAEAVKSNVQKLFKASDAMVAKLFSGEPVALKKDIDKAGAMKYRAVLKQAGAKVYIRSVDEPIAVPGEAKPKINPFTEEGKKELAKQREVQVTTWDKPPEWEPMPLGADVGEIARDQTPPVDLVVEDYGLADAGEELDELPRYDADALESVAELNVELADIGEDVLDEAYRKEEEALEVDVSALSMAQAGADVVEDKFKKPEIKVDVDISNIHLSE